MTPTTPVHEQFLASVCAAREYYATGNFSNKTGARGLLEEVCGIIRQAPREQAIEWLKGEMKWLYRPLVAGHWVFALDLLEYCFRALRWKEGHEMLLELFNETTDPSYRLALEVMIRRIYDRDWDGGNCVFSDLGPSVWDLVEENDAHC